MLRIQKDKSSFYNLKLINFPDTLLLVYRNAADFHTLILYPEHLLNSLMSYNDFLVESSGYSVSSVMSSADSGSFTSFYPICIPLISFSSLMKKK